ncbi:hypothetical protein NDU88_003642 [Pleurodeles waltl]|uniref:Uncharacterized protein n=1 Tax=Pleurodeles waltl TaxID=8319 RepID=A0AAV7T5J2_PLEWA|nr:hypothetical protein NDU88_003642 [Pleurodeles waltl]
MGPNFGRASTGIERWPACADRPLPGAGESERLPAGDPDPGWPTGALLLPRDDVGSLPRPPPEAGAGCAESWNKSDDRLLAATPPRADDLNGPTRGPRGWDRPGAVNWSRPRGKERGLKKKNNKYIFL